MPTMTVAELIKELLEVDDHTKTVCVFNDWNINEVVMVDELSDRVDLNIETKDADHD
jgi:hypothetical protein